MNLRPRRMAYLACAALLVAACSVQLVPPPTMPEVTRRAMPDEALLDQLRHDWADLHLLHMPDAERQALILRYNKNLLTLIKRYRADMFAKDRGKAGSMLTEGLSIADEQHRVGTGTRLRDIYDDMVPAADVKPKELAEFYEVPGIGVPVLGIVPANKVKRLEDAYPIRSKGTVRHLTVLLEFPENAPPCLRLIPRSSNETARIGRLNYNLAGHFSALIEQYWSLTQVDKQWFLGLVQPQKLSHVTGLSCVEGYQAQKIPVILTHGLISSAGTFSNLVNRLMRDPEIRQHYQFWYFNYPTGVAWTLTAREYRHALNRLRDEVDPAHRNGNWDKMVVVGHSMGGLITHYSQCEEPWRIPLRF